MSNMDAGNSLRWLFPQQWCHGIISTPHTWPRTPKTEPSKLDKCARLLLYAYGKHINVLKHFVYVKYGCRKQFEVAVSLNHDIIMMSFWLHKLPRTPHSAPSRVGITVQGCYCMLMDSIHQCAQTLHLCLIWIQEAVWDGCQPQPWHHNDIISTPHKWPTEPPKLSQVWWTNM